MQFWTKLKHYRKNRSTDIQENNNAENLVRVSGSQVPETQSVLPSLAIRNSTLFSRTLTTAVAIKINSLVEDFQKTFLQKLIAKLCNQLRHIENTCFSIIQRIFNHFMMCMRTKNSIRRWPGHYMQNRPHNFLSIKSPITGSLGLGQSLIHRCCHLLQQNRTKLNQEASHHESAQMFVTELKFYITREGGKPPHRF